MNKKILLAFALFFVAIGGWFGYKEWIKKGVQREVISIIPEDAVYILQTDNLTRTWEEVQETNIWQHLIKTKGFEDFEELTKTLNSVLLQNKASNYLLKDRPTLMSAHLTKKKDYDFIYSADLKSAKNFKAFMDALLKLDKQHKIVKLTYKREKIYKLIDKKDPSDFFFLFSLDNLLVSSYNYALIKQVIDEKDRIHWLNNPDFKRVNKDSGDELVRFYFNFKQLPGFANIYLDDGEKITSGYAKALKLSGFDISHEDERILMNGITLPDSVSSYFNAMLDVKPGKVKAYRIVTKRAAVYTSLGFKDFNLFYRSLLEQLPKKEKYALKKQTQSMEKYFKIDLEKDLFDWIGQEIAIVKIYTGKKQRPEDVIALIQAEDIKEAKKGMNRILERLRKKSPVKFKSYTYNNFSINYLYQKGFFKVLLGDLLKKIDKPYFTYIEDYVVFSNSEHVLKEFIDDYIKGKTLSHSPDFMDFQEEWNRKANLSVYLQMPKFYKILEKDLSPETKKSLAEKKNFILSMSRIAFQLTSDNDVFNTQIIIDHDEEALKKEQADELASKIDETVHNKYYEDLQFKIFFPDSLEVEDGHYRVHYEDGKTIKREGKVVNGLPEGIWRTYYPSGNLESVVNYKEGEVDGKAFFYFDKSRETKKAEMNFDRDLLDGLYTEYWPNGAVKAELEYKNGKLNGQAKYYYSTGKLKIEGKYKKGEKKGKWIYYDPKGKVLKKERFSGFLF